MEKKLITEINIEDKAITHFASFTLQQEFNNHHYFELHFNHDQMGMPGLITLDDSRDFVGKTLTASFGFSPDKLQTFSGLVTRVGLSQSHGYHGVLVISGYSPTILIDRGPDLGSYLDKGLNDIVKLATKDTPANDLSIVANAARSSNIDYLIQYRESDFDFLNRLSGEYHEWFFYDGKQLNFGKPDEQKSVNLFYGRDVQTLEYAIEVSPIKYKRFSYNPKQDEMLHSESTGKPDGNPDLAHAISASNSMYSKTYNQPSLIRVDNSGDIKAHVENEEKANISELLKVTGAGDNAELCIGSVADITMSLKQEISFATESLGKFLITNIYHHVDGTGKYHNTFEGLVSTTERIRVRNFSKPSPDMQLADVIDNADPQGQGRIKVKLKWECQHNDVTEWLRVITPDAGSSEQVSKNRGFVFIPEIGDQVAVSFEEGNIARPIVLGSVFHGKNGKGGSASNNEKSLTSKSGHTVQLNDGGGITIRDKTGGNHIIVDGENKITVTSTQTVVLTNGSSSITLEKDQITIHADKIEIAQKDGAKSSKIDINGTATNVNTQDLKIDSTTNTIKGGANTITGTNHVTGGDTKIDGGDVFIN